jgi:cobalt-precorrin 5A hydrolase
MIKVVALTPSGAETAKRICEGMKDATCWLPRKLSEEVSGTMPFESLSDVIHDAFENRHDLICVMASGIVVRMIAPYLKGKDRDPAVVVLDEKGRFAISLLSGHIGGANDLAREAARITGGRPVITTATDTAGVSAVDLVAKDRNLSIANLEVIKTVNMALLKGEPIQIHDPEDRLEWKEDPPGAVIRVDEEAAWDRGVPGVWVSWRVKVPETHQLVLHPRCLIAGIGCNRGTEAEEILGLIHRAFDKANLSRHSVGCLTSIEEKRDEAGLLEAARRLNVPLFFYQGADLAAVEVPHPSKIVKKHMGVESVCEATAMLKSRGGRLLVPKTKSRNVTLAVVLEA